MASDLPRLRDAARMAVPAEPGSELFLEELERLTIISHPAALSFARLGAVARYRDLRTKRERAIKIVPPQNADGDENAVSVLTPIGAALIGLKEGSIFRWGEPGRTRAVKLLAVET
jgi:regulator of nucleoside diphosphate kinase